MRPESLPFHPPPAAEADAGHSQSVRAQLRLRELLLAGALAPGARITELALVERLGVSRTPIRAALQRLQDEGLVEPLPGGGYAVPRYDEADIRDAIELRGTLEGLVARRAAERGAAAAQLAEMSRVLDAIDAVLSAPELDDEAFAAYEVHNGRFHTLLAGLCGSALLQRQIERAWALPFASPNGFVMHRPGGPQARDSLLVAQSQHRAVVEAVAAREGARAEAVMREHARLAQHNLNATLSARNGQAPATAAATPDAPSPPARTPRRAAPAPFPQAASRRQR